MLSVAGGASHAGMTTEQRVQHGKSTLNKGTTALSWQELTPQVVQQHRGFVSKSNGQRQANSFENLANNRAFIKILERRQVIVEYSYKENNDPKRPGILHELALRARFGDNETQRTVPKILSKHAEMFGR